MLRLYESNVKQDRLAPRPAMSVSSFLSVSRVSGSAPITVGRRSSRRYCWTKCGQWNYNTYPRSLLKHVESNLRPLSSANVGQLRYLQHSKVPGAFDHNYLPLGGWRLSSSWGRWDSRYSAWNESDRQDQRKGEQNSTPPSDWDRSLSKLEKDTAELFELFKKRIDADPFEALFGRGIIRPGREAPWHATKRDQGSRENGETAKSKKQTQQEESMEDVLKQPDTKTAAPRTESKGAGPTSASIFKETQSPVQDYEIDPITMRRRTIVDDQSSGTPVQWVTADKAVDIPVKPFHGTPDKQGKMPRAPTNPEICKNTPHWLAQEGFASQKTGVPKIQATDTDGVSGQSTRLESAVDRRDRLRTQSQSDMGIHERPSKSAGTFDLRKGIRGGLSELSADSNNSQSDLEYDMRENKSEDIDLLRASDVRASSGLGSHTRKEGEVHKRRLRQGLEDRYMALLRETSGTLELLRDLRHQRMERCRATLRRRDEVRKAHLDKEISAQKGAMEAMEMQHAKAPATSEATSAAHPEQGEGDMARNVHEFASRDRWYKRKAPHAAGFEERKAIQSAKDQSLVGEIRGIYEDTYGVIDTQHRQAAKVAPPMEFPISDGTTKPRTPARQEKGSNRGRKDDKPSPISKGPLSTLEKIGTLLQQLSDDSCSLQKLLRTSSQLSQVREELFWRNRSMRNASDAIAEALSGKQPGTEISEARFAQAVHEKEEKLPVSSGPDTGPSVPFDAKKSLSAYSVLAYDPSTQQVTTAELASPNDAPSERRLSLSEALSTLTEPAKLLPQLTSLQSQGYEIVSSDTNILVLRKTHKTPAPNAAGPSLRVSDRSSEKAKNRMNRMNPIDGTTTPTGNFASPTGFVNHDPILPPSELERLESEQRPSGYKMRREEEVFSGSGSKRSRSRQEQRTEHRRKRLRSRIAEDIIWTSLFAAGVCYTIGSIIESRQAYAKKVRRLEEGW